MKTITLEDGVYEVSIEDYIMIEKRLRRDCVKVGDGKIGGGIQPESKIDCMVIDKNKLKKFSRSYRTGCSKCDSHKLNVRWIAETNLMLLTCECGYEWNELPMDKKL